MLAPLYTSKRFAREKRPSEIYESLPEAVPRLALLFDS
jgi:hypothetical protein